MFEEVLNTFENQDIKNFAEELITTIPDYFWKVPASSTGKYHPKYALGRGGLYRHTLAVCRILNHLLSLEQYKKKYGSRERDLLRIAAIMHDSRKSGSQEEYEQNKHTKFNHPLLAAEVVLGYKGKKFVEDYEIEFIVNAISCHMGEFNRSDYYDGELPKPMFEYEKLLHLVDYLASRRDIEVKFNNQGFIKKIFNI